MALDLCQFDEGTTCSLIDSLLQEENEEMKEDTNLSTECPTNGGLKPTLTGERVSKQVSLFQEKEEDFSHLQIDHFSYRQL